MDAVGSSLVWAGFARASPCCSLSCSTGRRRTHRIRLDLTWRARMFLVVAVGVAAFLIALAVIV